MNEAKLREYAELIVKIGANVQKGQRVRLQTGVDQVQLATMVTEECYKAGASYVEVIWECGPINKLNYQYASAETLGTVQTWEEERLKQMTVDLPVRIFIDSSDPDELAGISADLLSTVRQMRAKVTKKYRDQIDGKHQWLIVAAPSPAWAAKVFPGEPEDVAVEKLWNAIFDCHAEQGEEVLKKMFAMDDGASMLGEVALVPKESPINQSGLMFFNTLFDENACCHVAAGAGFSEVLDGFMDMSDEEILAKGVNDSLIHVDFMVGSDDLHIVGIHEDGSETDVFVNGTWAE